MAAALLEAAQQACVEIASAFATPEEAEEANLHHTEVVEASSVTDLPANLPTTPGMEGSRDLPVDREDIQIQGSLRWRISTHWMAGRQRIGDDPSRGLPDRCQF